MSGRFEDQWVLVTGGSSGIGFAAAERMIDEGATVFITARTSDALADAADRLGPRAIPIQADSTSSSDRDRMVELVRSHTDHLDAVVANAGGGGFQPFGSWTESMIDDRFDVNVKGTAFTVQSLLPLLQPGASIVLIGSISGSTGIPGFGIYGASKAALRLFARVWSTDLADRGVRVNVLSPGHIYTEALTNAGMPRSAYDDVLPRIPAGRLGEASDVAGPIAFLASRDSVYITGAELFVDGGLTESPAVGPAA